jgi:hypothetical protein
MVLAERSFQIVGGGHAADSGTHNDDMSHDFTPPLSAASGGRIQIQSSERGVHRSAAMPPPGLRPVLPGSLAVINIRIN